MESPTQNPCVLDEHYEPAKRAKLSGRKLTSFRRKDNSRMNPEKNEDPERKYFLNDAEKRLGLPLDASLDHCYWHFYRQKYQTKLNLEKIPPHRSGHEVGTRFFSQILPTMNRILEYLPKVTWLALRTVSKPMEHVIIGKLLSLKELDSESLEILESQKCSSCILRRFFLLQSRCPNLEKLPRVFDELSQTRPEFRFEKLKELHLDLSDTQTHNSYANVRLELTRRSHRIESISTVSYDTKKFLDARVIFKIWLPNLRILSFRKIRSEGIDLLPEGGEMNLPHLSHFEFPEKYCCSLEDFIRLSKYSMLESIFMPPRCDSNCPEHTVKRFPPIPTLKSISFGHSALCNDWSHLLKGSPDLESATFPDDILQEGLFSLIQNAEKLRKLSFTIDMTGPSEIDEYWDVLDGSLWVSTLTHLSIRLTKGAYEDASCAINGLTNLKYLHVGTVLDSYQSNEVEVLSLDVALDTLCLTYTLGRSSDHLMKCDLEFSPTLEKSLRTLKISLEEDEEGTVDEYEMDTREGGKEILEKRLLTTTVECSKLKNLELYDPRNLLDYYAYISQKFYSCLGYRVKKLTEKPDFKLLP